MVTPVIHRIIESHAATCGQAVAVLGDRRSVTYRDLNQRANVVARRLHAAGFRRGGHAVIGMRRGVDVAVLLLAVLKAGGAYTWIDTCDDDERQVSIAPAQPERDHGGVVLDAEALVADGDAFTCPNLPVLVRGSDIACILRDSRGVPAILVPHATIASLHAHALPAIAPWPGEPGALDLWRVLMAGRTIAIADEPPRVAAA